MYLHSTFCLCSSGLKNKTLISQQTSVLYKAQMFFKLHVTLIFMSGAPGLPGSIGDRGYPGGPGLMGPSVSSSMRYPMLDNSHFV